MRAFRLFLLALGASCLAMGVVGGLVRLGVAIVAPREAVYHGLLMTGGFLGTVISLERAIALGKAWGFAAPLASASAALLLVMGRASEAAALGIVAPLALAAVSAALLRRQAQVHIGVMLAAAGCWAVGNELAFTGGAADASAAWWFAFLVLTIAAERLEMTRLAPRRPLAAPLFHGTCALLVTGAAAAIVTPAGGGALFGIALVALAAWLAAFDIARQTVRGAGFSRYAAVALLGGYAWLALGGLAWVAMALAGPAWRDAAIHAVGLGFVFSMILAHAPLVVPVVARVRMRYVPFLYVPLAALHLSVAARVLSDGVAPGLRPWGGLANAAALVAFAGTLAYTLRRKRRDGGPPPAPRP